MESGDLLKLLLLVIVTVASASKRIRFQHMVNQTLQGGESTIREGKAKDIEACALLCGRDRNCTSFSYQEETQQFSLSSEFPVITGISNQICLPAVFMKVPERFDMSESEISYNENMMARNNDGVEHHPGLPFLTCAERCLVNAMCVGFQYTPAETGCMIVKNIQSTEEGSVPGLLYYDITRHNIAEDKPAYQISTMQAAEFGNDGLYSIRCMTGDEMRPYWRVDLELTYRVLYVTVSNEKKAMENYPIPNPIVYIKASDDREFMAYSSSMDRQPASDASVCGYKEGDVTAARMRFICPQLLAGQYVFIDSYRDGNQHRMHFQELEVYGYISG